MSQIQVATLLASGWASSQQPDGEAYLVYFFW